MVKRKRVNKTIFKCKCKIPYRRTPLFNIYYLFVMALICYQKRALVRSLYAYISFVSDPPKWEFGLYGFPTPTTLRVQYMASTRNTCFAQVLCCQFHGGYTRNNPILEKSCFCIQKPFVYCLHTC